MSFQNHLPDHLGKTFLSELNTLVSQLAQEGGFKERYLESEMMSKFCDVTTVPPEERRAAAIEKWLSSEERNRKTNERLLIGDEDFGFCTSDKIIALACNHIRRVLGPISSASLSESWHTNGASTRLRRGVTTAIQKHSGKAHGTESARLQWSLMASDTILEDQTTECVSGSMLFTVPKKTEIDRVACKEPEVNLYLQRGVGNHIRRRLRRFGIDLNDQTRNQELARRGVELGLATLDLSSASDTISRELVRNLLPFEWFSYLDDIRSQRTLIERDGRAEWHELEMFSSMGNGFTFELETLIFWSLCHAIKMVSKVKGPVSVYGDDIIVPVAIARRIARLFNWFGFTTNSKKSSWSGPFRESCGYHGYGRRDVSPFYVREPVRTKTELIRILNRIMEWDSREWGFIVDPEVADFHYRWSQHIPRFLWGGQDPDAIEALVTGHSPRKRLSPITRRLSNVSEVYRYVYWFTIAEHAGGNHSPEVSPSDITGYKVSRPSFLSLDRRTRYDPWYLYHNRASASDT